MLKTQATSAANISLILFPSSHLQKDPNYSLQNNCMWVWLTAESWQDCSIIFSDDLQLQNQLISLITGEELGILSNSIPGWVSHSGPQEEDGVWWWQKNHYAGGRAPHQLTRPVLWWGLLLAGGLHSLLPWEVTNASSSWVVLQLFHIDTNIIGWGDLGIAKMCVKSSVDIVQQHTHNVWLLSVRRNCIRRTQQTLWLNNSLHCWCLSRPSGSTTMGLS